MPSSILNEDNNSRDSNASSSKSENTGFGPNFDSLGPNSHLSLLDQHNELKKKATVQKESEREKQLKEEKKILESLAETRALLSFSELAKGIQYLDPIKTSWTVPKCISNLPQERHDEVRKLTGIFVDGEEVPPPIASFKVLNSFKS